MTYDPMLSHSFADQCSPDLETIASYVLHNHSDLMDEDVCIEVNDDADLSLFDAPTDLQWLLKYMELHYKTFGTHFEWLPAKGSK
jgi:dihydroorotase-like cyclic amidohydrolase